MKQTILITGASGLLGSALCADLSRTYKVIGLYRRFPSLRQRQDCQGVIWERGEVADADCTDWIFRRNSFKGKNIDYVIHFAAYTHYGARWQDEYSNTNVIGTQNIINAAHYANVKRIIFAGSIAALSPPSDGELLTEKAPAGGKIAYPKSKAIGEKLLAENSDKVPVVILRIGGVFTHWCELPPLFSLIKMWSQPFLGTMIPGKGQSGFPYIHRKDVVSIVRRIIEQNDSLNSFETFFASPPGCTYQKDIFPIIRKECKKGFSIKPHFIPPYLAKMSLHAKYIINKIRKQKTYERAWMIEYVDRPLVVDTTYTKNKLNWSPTPELHILKYLPKIMDYFNNYQSKWYKRNILRNDQEYDYEPD